MNLENFVPFNFNVGIPRISVTNNGVTFNRAVTIKLNHPEFVEILINFETRQLAIRRCDTKSKNRVKYCRNHSERYSKVISVRFNNANFLHTISNMMNWNLNTNAYKVSGIYYLNESAIVFDLNTAKIL